MLIYKAACTLFCSKPKVLRVNRCLNRPLTYTLTVAASSAHRLSGTPWLPYPHTQGTKPIGVKLGRIYMAGTPTREDLMLPRLTLDQLVRLTNTLFQARNPECFRVSGVRRPLTYTLTVAALHRLPRTHWLPYPQNRLPILSDGWDLQGWSVNQGELTLSVWCAPLKLM